MTDFSSLPALLRGLANHLEGIGAAPAEVAPAEASPAEATAEQAAPAEAAPAEATAELAAPEAATGPESAGEEESSGDARTAEIAALIDARIAAALAKTHRS